MTKVKWLVISAAGVAILFVALNYSLQHGPTAAEYTHSMNEKWNFALPEPVDYEELWGTPSSFLGDGEWLTVLTYDKAIKDPESMGLVEVTEENIDEVRDHLDFFRFRTVEIYTGNEETQAEIENVFSENPVEVSIGDYFHHQTNRDDYDTFTAVYSVEQKKIWLHEWHQ